MAINQNIIIIITRSFMLIAYFCTQPKNEIMRERDTLSCCATLFSRFQGYKKDTWRQMIHNRLEFHEVNLVITTLQLARKNYSDISKKWKIKFPISSSPPYIHVRIPALNSDQKIFPSRFSSKRLNRRSIQ